MQKNIVYLTPNTQALDVMVKVVAMSFSNIRKLHAQKQGIDYRLESTPGKEGG